MIYLESRWARRQNGQTWSLSQPPTRETVILTPDPIGLTIARSRYHKKYLEMDLFCLQVASDAGDGPMTSVNSFSVTHFEKFLFIFIYTLHVNMFIQ